MSQDPFAAADVQRPLGPVTDRSEHHRVVVDVVVPAVGTHTSMLARTGPRLSHEGLLPGTPVIVPDGGPPGQMSSRSKADRRTSSATSQRTP